MAKKHIYIAIRVVVPKTILIRLGIVKNTIKKLRVLEIAVQEMKKYMSNLDHIVKSWEEMKSKSLM